MKKQIWEIGGCLSSQLNTVSNEIISGICGETLIWHLDNNSLVIEGSGDMYDYDSDEDAPWASVAEEVTSIVLPDEITRIGNNAFATCSNVGELTFDDNDCIFGTNAFNANTKTYLVIDEAKKKDFALHANTYYQIIIKRKLDNMNYGAIVMPFEPNAETRDKFKFYQIKQDGQNLVYSRVYAPVANVPYLYRNASSDSSQWATELTSMYNETIDATEFPSLSSGKWTAIGTYKNIKITDPEQLSYSYVVYNNTMANYTGSITVRPFRAYFEGPVYGENSNT